MQVANIAKPRTEYAEYLDLPKARNVRLFPFPQNYIHSHITVVKQRYMIWEIQEGLLGVLGGEGSHNKWIFSSLDFQEHKVICINEVHSGNHCSTRLGWIDVKGRWDK